MQRKIFLFLACALCLAAFLAGCGDPLEMTQPSRSSPLKGGSAPSRVGD